MLVTDLTPLVKARSEVVYMEADLEALHQVGPAGLLEMDAAGRLLKICQRVEEMTGPRPPPFSERT